MFFARFFKELNKWYPLENTEFEEGPNIEVLKILLLRKYRN